MRYSLLNEEKKIARCVTPVLVSATKNPDEETPEQVIENHERFRKLPFESRYKLGFQYSPEVIKKIGEEFKLEPLQMASIARVVRNFYFGDVSKEKISEFLKEDMGVDLEQAEKIAALVVQKIINVSVPKEISDETDNLPLLNALSKYQRLSEQTVTEDRIVVKGESQPVRGSIRNWLRNYRDSVGIRKHSAVERGQFLFQSDNTKRLGATEREKLSLLLRSLDENVPVSVDVERQEVVFPAIEEKEFAQSAPVAGQTLPSLETSFRPLEKFPAQVAPIQKVLEWNAKTQYAEPSKRENAPASNQEGNHSKASPFENKSSSNHMPSARAAGVSAPVYGAPMQSRVPEAPFSSNGNISFSSSHVLPHEKADEKVIDTLQKNQESTRSASEPLSRGPEAISVIKPRGNAFGFRRGTSGHSGSVAGGGFDTPRVVNLRSSGGMRQDKTGA